MNMQSEKEKMLSGMPYMASDEVLVSERLRARTLIFEFNNLRPNDAEKGIAIIRELIGRCGDRFFIEPPFRCDYGYNIEMGENFYSNFNLIILDCARVTIGSNVLIAPNVGIFTAGHPLQAEARNAGYEFALPVAIGNNVWIGGNVVINPGVSIGDNSVIGSGSVVTRNIPADVVAAGNPCRVLRKIAEDEKTILL